MISDRYPNKDNRDALGGIIITWIDVIRVTRREQLCIFIKHEDFEEHKLHSVQKWFRVIRECSETHGFKESKDKEEMGEVIVKNDARETPIHATTQVLERKRAEEVYEVGDDILPDPKNTPITQAKVTNQYIKRDGNAMA